MIYNWTFVSLAPPHLLCALAATALFAVSVSFVGLLDATCKWNHRVAILGGALSYFTYSNSLKVHSCCKWQDLILYG